VQSPGHVHVDLIDQDHRIADNHSTQRNDSENGDKPHRRAGRQQSRDDPDQTQRCDADHQDHLLKTLQLNHQNDLAGKSKENKYVILIGSGRDTFSKITLDKMLQKVKATPNVTIFTISTGGFVRAMSEGRGGMGGQIREMDYLQADNEMNTIARMTGGMHFEPRFQGELPDDFSLINESIRNQYVLTYKPSNTKQDGTYRKLQVELVDNEGHPLKMQDEKHKPLKYDIISRDGYKAKQEVE